MLKERREEKEMHFTSMAFSLSACKASAKKTPKQTRMPASQRETASPQGKELGPESPVLPCLTALIFVLMTSNQPNSLPPGTTPHLHGHPVKDERREQEVG
ncbi:hypothetical protein XENORESO_018522 [Xenotaenia resolanae]|uniref:Uncharacterized protein n=1 Tax=Xenotaenia resolanae TaxID=208358 RepID=A0ABV0WRQ3_9TELE